MMVSGHLMAWLLYCGGRGLYTLNMSWSGVLGKRIGEEKLVFCCWEQNPTSSSLKPRHYTIRTLSAPDSVLFVIIIEVEVIST